MARVYKDGNGTGYNGTDAKFENTPFGTFLPSGKTSKADWTTTGIVAYTPFDFTSKEALEKMADNTVLGNMMDCGECHVGGGAMEYIPNATPAARVPLRTNAPTTWTGFNSFIDIFGPKGDGKGATYQGVQNDFAQSGVLEMDCMVCHLKDYNWEERKAAVRVRAFDASRATGAGFGHYSTGATVSRTVKYDPKKVVSDGEGGYKLAPDVAAGILAKPDSKNCASCHFATVQQVPDSPWSGKFQVEWKKRGEFWGGSEVHTGLGCMACHERKDLTTTGKIDPANVGTSGAPNLAAANKKLSLCDPAKGGDSDYDAQWNAVDKSAFKSCNDCHKDSSQPIATQNGFTYSAESIFNPSGMHASKGLTAKIVQKQYSSNGQLIATKNGVANASHLDIIDCAVCHVRKLDVKDMPLYSKDANGFPVFRKYTSFSITGGAMVDGSGRDKEGRMTTHDTVQVEREMKDNIALYWKNGKIFTANLLSSWFIRDANGLTDFNLDGRGGGVDPPLPTHIARINEIAGYEALTEDGLITPSEIADHFTAIKNNLKTMIGYTATGDAATDAILPKLSMAGVPFKISHNVAKAGEAWGANGCKDCHSAGSGFYNGAIVISPKTSFTYDSDQVASFAKVNGSVDATDTHPNLVNKSGLRSVAVQVVQPTTPKETKKTNLSLKDVIKAQLLYEDTFKTRDFEWKDTISGAERDAACTLREGGLATGAITTDGSVGKPTSPWYCAGLGTGGAAAGSTATKGWLLKIETKADGSSTVVTRTKQVSSDTLTSVTELVANLNSGNNFCNNSNFEFTCDKDAAAEKLVITAKSGYKIRISPQSDSGPLGLAGAVWKAEKIKGTNGVEYAGRADYVAYLNKLAAPSFANISSVNGVVSAGGTQKIEVEVSKSVQLVADQSGNGADTTYTWQFNDGSADLTGATVDKTFTTAGNVTVKLITKSPAADDGYDDGYEQTIDTQWVYVKPATPANTGAALTVTAPEINPTDPAKTDLGLSWIATPPAFDQVRIVWGDGVLEIKNVAALSGTQSHAYKRLARALGKNGAVSTEYGYLTKFYFYDGKALVASKEVPVVLETTSDLVLGARLTRAIVAKDADSVTYKMKKGSETYLVFTLNNKGPGTNTISEVAIPALPSGLTLSSSLKTMGAFDPSTLKWTGITLGKGKTAYLTLRVKLAKTAGDIVYEIPETGIITSTLKDSKTTTVKDVKITAVD